MISHMTVRKCNQIILLENNKMLPCKIKCRKNKSFFLARGANPRALACEPATLTIRLYASHGIAAVETACNRELCDTIAQLVT